MPRFVEVLVVGTGPLAVALRRDDHLLSCSSERIDHPFISIKGFVGDQCVGAHVWQQVVGADQIMHLAAGQMEADRIAKGIDQGVDFGAQSAARTPDSLVFADFF
jgi:hypothetical protein